MEAQDRSHAGPPAESTTAAHEFLVDGHRTTLADLLAANTDDPAVCEWAATAQPGDRFAAFAECVCVHSWAHDTLTRAQRLATEDPNLAAGAPALFDALETLVDALTTGAGRDFIEAFCRDGMAVLEFARPGWNNLKEPARSEVAAKACARASAQDLLAALQRLLPLLEITMVETCYVTGIREATAAARAAIAKATGSAE